MRAGELFTCEFYEDSPSILATGGNKGMLAIWDIHENKQLAQKFWGQETVDQLNQEEEAMEGSIVQPRQPTDDEPMEAPSEDKIITAQPSETSQPKEEEKSE